MAASDALELRVGARLSASGKTVATAESCTGGLIAHRLTNVSGASDYVVGGVVAYSNAVKVALLGVREDFLASKGAVSEIVAREMAQGVRRRLDADFGVGVTGIAGPSGGTPEKPVGLVFIAIADREECMVERCAFSGDREGIKKQTADRALSMLLERIA